MHPRVEIIADVAGVKPGDILTEESVEKLIKTIVHDVLHYIHHVDSGKYEKVSQAVDRIEELVRESYDLK